MADKKAFSKEELQKKLDESAEFFADSLEKMGAKLKKLLENEIVDLKKYERLRGVEMIRIFAAHNFYSNGFSPVELRTTLEDLGPTYVKIGQIMSSRPDLLPESYCTELKKLRQSVKPLDAEIARAVIEDETGKKIEDIFSEFRDEPLGSASIGQVHYGVLKDGTKVVIKVQRPLIADMMAKDFAILKKLVGVVNVVASSEDEGQVVDLVSVIEELRRVSTDELDFRVEAENTKFFKENCIDDEDVISCPTVIDELTTQRIFTMTYVDGYSVSHKDRMIEDGYDVYGICSAIVDNYVHQILDVGTFHADPHQGNIMVSKGKPYWIDFGMIGRITKKEIDQIQSMILSIVNNDSEGLINTVMSMGCGSAQTDRDKLTQDVELFLTRFNGASSISDVDVSSLMTEVMDLAAKHHVKMPGSFTLLARSVITIEGVIEQLCPELNLLEIISRKLIERLKMNFSIKQAILDAGKNLIGLGKKAAEIPGLAADALNGLAKGRTKINMEITGIDEPLEKTKTFAKYIMLAFISCVLFLGSCILASVDIQPKTPTGVPILAVIIMTFSVALGIYSFRKMNK